MSENNEVCDECGHEHTVGTGEPEKKTMPTPVCLHCQKELVEKFPDYRGTHLDINLTVGVVWGLDKDETGWHIGPIMMDQTVPAVEKAECPFCGGDITILIQAIMDGKYQDDYDDDDED